MINFSRTSLISIGLALAASFQTSDARESSIEVIVLTDNAGDSGIESEAMSSRRGSGRRDEIRQQILEDIKKHRAEMAANGFVVGTDAIISSKDRFPEELVKHQAVTGNTYDSVLPDFAYAARNLNDSPFGEGRLLGFMPVRSDDSKIHETVWAYAMPGIGRVIVEELSYRTIPDVTIKVAEPSGNIQVNGNPGTYMVMTDEKGKRGVTTIEFMTSDKLFTITVFAAVKRNNKHFKRLLTLAESLY